MDHQHRAKQMRDQRDGSQAAEAGPEVAGVRVGAGRHEPRAVSAVGATLPARSRRRRRWRVVLPALALALTIALAACGSSSSSSSPSAGASSSATATSSHVKLAKTKFVLHAGLAFGAFHRWIYKPVKAGNLKQPLSHKVALVKAGLAAAFVYRELGLALKSAQGDPTLSKVVAPLTALKAKIKGMPQTLKNGSTNPADVTGSNDLISSIKQHSGAAGQPVTDQVPASLTAGP